MSSAGLLADGVVTAHAAFILFAVFGGLLIFDRPWVACVHLPALAWAAWIEFSGGICPLTPLEQRLRHAAGEAGYTGGFIDHYVVPVIYPEGLTRDTQLVLGGLLLALNAAIYFSWFTRRRDAV